MLLALCWELPGLHAWQSLESVSPVPPARIWHWDSSWLCINKVTKQDLNISTSASNVRTSGQPPHRKWTCASHGQRFAHLAVCFAIMHQLFYQKFQPRSSRLLCLAFLIRTPCLARACRILSSFRLLSHEFVCFDQREGIEIELPNFA